MIQVPFFRPEIGNAEIEEVVSVLRSGWLTTGPRVREFEQRFAQAVHAEHAIALNSCTAGLHLAVEALGLAAGQGVLVPTMTFAATAEVIRYLGAVPILVDCDEHTGQIDPADAAAKLRAARAGTLGPAIPKDLRVVGIVPVHVGGVMMDLAPIHQLAAAEGLWVVEDAAHAFPAAWRSGPDQPWVQCGERTAAVTCFSFYANKTITTGEGGMNVTADPRLAERMRLMSLHGLSHDAWERYSGGKSWDYRIVAPGYKYNLTDLAAAVGLHQLARAEEMRARREAIALTYLDRLSGLALDLPERLEDRLHAWHLFPVRLRLAELGIDRNQMIDELRARGIGCSVHWRPLHLHPYYQESFGWQPEHCPRATASFPRLLSLPLFSGMTPDEVTAVTSTVQDLVRRHGH